jgi:hypothetical protein
MFDIQISNPIAIEIRDVDDENIKEAIESVFPLENEYCFIIWNHLFIPVSYKYDISCMINDIIKIVNFIKNGDGVLEINWGSDTFSASWRMECTSDTIRIESKWVSVLGKLERLLNDNSILEVKKQVFVEKWIALLLFVKGKLEKAGYNSSNLEDFYQLENINSYTANPDNFFQ